MHTGLVYQKMRKNRGNVFITEGKYANYTKIVIKNRKYYTKSGNPVVATSAFVV